VYATCSFAPEENENNIDRALSTFDGAIQLEPLGIELENFARPLQSWRGKQYRHDLSLARRILPTATMEGFFICKMKKVYSA